MSQFRSEKVNSIIQQELSKVFLRELELPEGVLLTVSGVEVDQKIDKAEVFVSIFPFNKSGQILSTLNKRIGYWQKILNKKIKMHFVPQIIFVLDTTENKAETVEELINKVSKHN